MVLSERGLEFAEQVSEGRRAHVHRVYVVAWNEDDGFREKRFPMTGLYSVPDQVHWASLNVGAWASRCALGPYCGAKHSSSSFGSVYAI